MKNNLKNVACISFTANGSRINRSLERWFMLQGIDCDCQALSRYAKEAGVKPLQGSLKEWCRDHFQSADVLIFIGAAGIAVRGIAPWVADKKTDPAVLVIDEQGTFVISLLSGHIGGANEMTLQVAEFLHAVPVITTGTDVNHTFAVDVFARANHLQIDDMQMAKKVAACLIDKEIVGFASELPVKDQVPAVLAECFEGFHHPCKAEIRVTIHRMSPEKEKERVPVLRLIPKNVHLGIGCRRGTSFAQIEKKVQEVIADCGLDWQAVAGVASIDLKQEEEGLKRFCKEHELPFCVYSAKELLSVEGEFTPSRFVGSITGVDNVCERSAALDCIRNRYHADARNQTGTYRMIQKKVAGDGVTVAVAMEDWSVKFE